MQCFFHRALECDQNPYGMRGDERLEFGKATVLRVAPDEWTMIDCLPGISQSFQEAPVLINESSIWPRCMPRTSNSISENLFTNVGHALRLITPIARMMRPM